MGNKKTLNLLDFAKQLADFTIPKSDMVKLKGGQSNSPTDSDDGCGNTIPQ